LVDPLQTFLGLAYWAVLKPNPTLIEKFSELKEAEQILR